MAPVFMVNPKRNKAGQFVKSTRKSATSNSKSKPSTKKRAAPKRAAAARKPAAQHIVIDMGARTGLVKAKKGVYNVNPKRNAAGKFVKNAKKSTASAHHKKRPAAKHTASKKKHHYRRNPKGQLMTVMKGALLPAMIFPTSAIAGDLLYGVLPLPASMRTGFMKPVGKLGIAAVLGALGSFVLPARYATLVAGGLIGGVVYDMGKSYLQTTFPTLPLAGTYDYPGLEYEQAGMHGAAPSFLGNNSPSFLGDSQMGPMGNFVRPDNVSAYVDNE